MSLIITYYAKTTDYQFKTEPMIVFPKPSKNPEYQTVRVALHCQVPVGVDTAYLTRLEIVQDSHEYSGTATVSYTYKDGVSDFKHQVEYILDRSKTKVTMRNKR